MAFTYTTMYTAVAEEALRRNPVPLSEAARSASPLLRLTTAAAEPWQPGSKFLDAYECLDSFASGRPRLAEFGPTAADLVLFNRRLPDLPSGRPSEARKTHRALVPWVGYRIYNTSDELFYSQPGVAGGYYFRRRPPARLLEPLRDAC